MKDEIFIDLTNDFNLLVDKYNALGVEGREFTLSLMLMLTNCALHGAPSQEYAMEAVIEGLKQGIMQYIDEKVEGEIKNGK